MKKLSYLLLLLLLCVASVAYSQDWMPDPILRKVVRTELNIAESKPLTKADMHRLLVVNPERVKITEEISDLTGLEYAVRLHTLLLRKHRVWDLRPIANLTNLRYLGFGPGPISDITPLTGLVNLKTLGIERNQIVDVSPLANLINLKDLKLAFNQIEDFSPLAGLVNLERLRVTRNRSSDISMIPTSGLKVLAYDETCNMAGIPISDRIENREYPSVSGVWSYVSNKPPVIPTPETSEIKPNAYFDLRVAAAPQTLRLGWAFNQPGSDEAVRLIATGTANIEDAKQRREAILAFNPNAILLVQILYYSGLPARLYPEDGVLQDLYLRDKNGNRIGGEVALLDFTLPETQEFVFNQIRAVKACGLFDGIFFDFWGGGQTLAESRTGRTQAEEYIARDRIIQEARAIIGGDMLILVNTGERKIPRWAEYINGTFMETHPIAVKVEGTDKYHHLGYTRDDLLDIEDTLVWSETHFREPRINILQGQGIDTEPPDSPRNKQWMRTFTAMSLTLSDGYVQYLTLRGTYGPEVYWHPFYDAPLGRSVGEKGQRYKTPKGVFIEGVFIREFANGWAVYNRSGKEQNIYLPEKVSGVASGVQNKHWHILPDLDGEIYLKRTAPLDTTRPGVGISAPAETQDGAFDTVITFTEPVSDFGQTDVSISGTATATITAWTASEDATTYTVTITPTTSGTLILNVNENVAADEANNPNTAATEQTLTVQLIPAWDVNGDGTVNVLDLILVAQHLGETSPANSEVDVNADGSINILDLIAVAQHIGESTTLASPSILAIHDMEELNPEMIQVWIKQAQIENDGSTAFQQGIANLQRLLASLIPEKTALLANYPNPFNPETWIPYQLAEPAKVTFRIYTTSGVLVRTLAVGYRPVGVYQARSRAAYWDGKNDVGESVASGIYFYTLTAGDFIGTRKLLIMK